MTVRGSVTELLDIARYLRRRGDIGLHRLAFQLGYQSELLDETALRTHALQTDSVLFLCHGNICRSPFAAEYLSSQLSRHDLEVQSAGFHPEAGRSSPEEAIGAAARFDVDLTDHSSRVVSRELVEASDLVLLMDIRNFLSWRRRYGALPVQPFFLGSMITNDRRTFELQDPFNGTIADYQNVYQDIANCIDPIIESFTRD